jgi:hypothetical protein
MPTTFATQTAQSRHPDRVGECPLSGVKRTSKFKSVTSAFDPNRKSSDQFCCGAHTPPRLINDVVVKRPAQMKPFLLRADEVIE